MLAVVHIWGRFPFWSRILNLLIKSLLLRHPIFSSYGHYCCVIFSAGFFRLAHLALQNVNKDYVIPKTKNATSETGYFWDLCQKVLETNLNFRCQRTGNQKKIMSAFIIDIIEMPLFFQFLTQWSLKLRVKIT